MSDGAAVVEEMIGVRAWSKRWRVKAGWRDGRKDMVGLRQIIVDR